MNILWIFGNKRLVLGHGVFLNVEVEMVDCCNSDQVQSTYSAMISAFKETVVSVLEVFFNISQHISEIDLRNFKVCKVYS